jgi:hypothetical protein
MKAMNMVVAIAAVAGVGGCAVDDVDHPVEAETATVEQAATVDVWTGTWNGASASAWSYGAFEGGYIDAFENKTPQGRRAFLNFTMWSVDPTSEQCSEWTDWWGSTYTWCWFTRSTYTYGWGEIPQQLAQFTATTARVKGTLPASFSGYVCNFDWEDWTSAPCSEATGGAIDVRWNKDGGYSHMSSGTQQQSYGTFTFKTQGTYRSTSAQAQGTILGLSFHGSGGVGTTRGVNVAKSVQRTPKP